MTWTQVSPSATQAIDGSKVIWSTYRTIGGNVQVRATDILAIESPGDYVNQWTKAKLTIELLDSSNVLRSKAVTLNKTWGTKTPWVSLGLLAKRSLKIRSSLMLYGMYKDKFFEGGPMWWTQSAVGRLYYDEWHIDLRWDNATGGATE